MGADSVGVGNTRVAALGLADLSAGRFTIAGARAFVSGAISVLSFESGVRNKTSGSSKAIGVAVSAAALGDAGVSSIGRVRTGANAGTTNEPDTSGVFTLLVCTSYAASCRKESASAPTVEEATSAEQRRIERIMDIHIAWMMANYINLCQKDYMKQDFCNNQVRKGRILGGLRPLTTIYWNTFSPQFVLRPKLCFLTALLFIAMRSPVHANFQVCNQTLDVVNVAIGTYDVDAWETSGWWTIGPNQCANVIEETLTTRYIYVYARDVFNASMLAGSVPMCVDPGEFRIRGREDCLIKGHIATEFTEVDTRRSERWTFFMTSPMN